MAKLYYYYGTVASSKTLHLISCNRNYQVQGKRSLLVKPSVDSRSVSIESRMGCKMEPDLVISPADLVSDNLTLFPPLAAILVDECQFLTRAQVKDLRKITIEHDIPVLCYGLRTTSDGELFPSIETLFALADSVLEIKTICVFCNKKANFSKAVEKSDSVVNPSWDGFIPVCAGHFYD